MLEPNLRSDLMNEFSGTPRRRGGRFPRRDLLRAGGLGLAGAWPAASQTASSAEETAPALPLDQGFGRAKRCLLLYIYGAWSQLDTFDPKPAAPAETRGEFGAISSAVPGVHVSEHLPRAASVLDRCTLIRSMSHPWNIHSAAYTLTGNPHTERIEGRQRHPEHWPYFGGVLDWLGDQGELDSLPPGVPRNVMLPWKQSVFAAPLKRAGTFGGFLGPAYDPLWTTFHGEAPWGDPFRGITPAGRLRFDVGDAAESTAPALAARSALLARLESGTRALQRLPRVRSYNRHRQRALEFMAHPHVRNALRIGQESRALRDAYGMTLFGQSCLSARRLLESGVQLVTVVWDEFGKTDESWDTHHDHHSRMKGYLLPGFDQAFGTLLADMDRRGLLEDTLVLCLSEHGRTPRFYATSAGAPGRDHWSRAYCQLAAGAGVPRGQVIGRTDGQAGDVVDRPIDPKDILCTAYHLLGVDVRQRLASGSGRTVPLVGGGRVVPELIG